MIKVIRPKVSFIDKETMCAIDPNENCIEIFANEEDGTMGAFVVIDGQIEELEIKFLGTNVF